MARNRTAIMDQVIDELNESGSIHGYNLLKLLGKGGQGSVFLAEKDDTKKRYAIKVVPPDFAPGADKEKVKLAEELCAEKLNSKYLMKYIDHFREDIETPEIVNCTFLVMDLCSGGDLSNFIQELKDNKRMIGKKDFMRLFAQSCVGMYILHKEHIMHRDLKPENIFLDDEKNAKVADFGASKLFFSTIDVAITEIGTMYWTAPEKSAIYSFPSDVYTLGLVFFYLAKLELPKGLESPEVLAQRLPEANPSIPQSVADLLVAMFSKEPSKRPTMKQIVCHPDVKEAILLLPLDTLPPGLLDHINGVTPS